MTAKQRKITPPLRLWQSNVLILVPLWMLSSGHTVISPQPPEDVRPWQRALCPADSNKSVGECGHRSGCLSHTKRVLHSTGRHIDGPAGPSPSSASMTEQSKKSPWMRPQDTST